MSKKDKDKMITLSKVKSEYGFTDKLVKEFLGEPDEYVTNPIVKKAAPMKLYKVKRVEKVIKTKKFQKAFEKSLIKKKSAKKAVETKTAKTIKNIKEKIDAIEVTKLNVSDEELRNLAIKNYRRHREMFNAFYDRYYDNLDLHPEEADSSTIDRWTVNFIRHNLTKYDSDLYNMYGCVGKYKAYVMYKEAVLTKIAEVYPKYEEECKRQMSMYKDIEDNKEEVGGVA